jgi:hypothetical protein
LDRQESHEPGFRQIKTEILYWALTEEAVDIDDPDLVVVASSSRNGSASAFAISTSSSQLNPFLALTGEGKLMSRVSLWFAPRPSSSRIVLYFVLNVLSDCQRMQETGGILTSHVHRTAKWGLLSESIAFSSP